ncbi:hypothetical protein M427DRAFT_64968 [Gonapodya prolifera JEL478]|uniref:N1221-domain-containing protein n=1 Tax=Gonapodya prolifera (strain JEL478) TaxID=1344416 RepID=A0A138ZWX7_GONPJ|nr:hypothetical protein M427DRAFT_64968 [Gonapodya prolifera JEL478]|eukprot:KXS08961.1 hypothetical protein M427DRAFT_64968 [Gonapodya prolifera JEL478]
MATTTENKGGLHLPPPAKAPPIKRFTTILNASQLYARSTSPAQSLPSTSPQSLSPSFVRAAVGTGAGSGSGGTTSSASFTADEVSPTALRERSMEHAEETIYPGAESRASSFDPDDGDATPVPTRTVSSSQIDERNPSPPPVRGGSAGAQPSGGPESLTLTDLQRLVKLAAKSKAPLYDFTYADTDEIQHEVDEFYNYQDGPHVQDGRALFERVFDGKWTETAEPDQLIFVSCILEDLESRDVDRRCAAAKILQYISQGTFAETSTVAAHVDLIIRNTRLLRKANSLPYLYAALRLVSATLDKLVHEAQPSPVDPAGSHVADFVGPHQGALDSANVEVGIYLSVMYMIVAGCTGEEGFGRELVETDPPVVAFLFGLVARLAEGNRKHYPVKKLLLLTWKTMLATLGGTERMLGIKAVARQQTHLPPSNPDNMYAKADPQEYLQFLNDTTSRYPSVYLPSLADLTGLVLPWDYFPRPPNSGQQVVQPVLLALPAVPSGNPGVPPSLRQAVESYRRNMHVRLSDLQIARERERAAKVSMLRDAMGPYVGPNGAVMEYGAGKRKDDDFDDLEGGSLPVSKKSSNKVQAAAGMDELTVEAEDRYADSIETDAEFLEREEIVYRHILRLLPLCITTLVRLLYYVNIGQQQANLSGPGAAQTRDGTEEASDSTAASSEQAALPGQDRKEYVDRMDLQRHKEVVTKAVSAILVLLLKHGKLGHALHFEHICQLLHDNNCAILILKMLSTWFQNPNAGAGNDGSKSPAPGSAAANAAQGGAGMAAAWLAARENVNELNFFWFCRNSPDQEDGLSTFAGGENSAVGSQHSKTDVPPSPGSGPTQLSQQQSGSLFAQTGSSLLIPALAPQNAQRFQPSCWRNFFTSINLLRVLQKLTKRKYNRVLSLVQWKASAVLKRVLKVNHLAVQLYALKLLKSQLPYLGRKWRTSNMRVITAIYLHIRPDLKDDNLCCDMDVDNDDTQAQEQHLRLLVAQFHAQKYPDSISEAGAPAAERQAEDYPLELDGHQGTYTEALSLDDNFTENYEHWLNDEVYQRNNSEIRAMFGSQQDDDDEGGRSDIFNQRLMIDEVDGF